jgi:hypothetical protein
VDRAASPESSGSAVVQHVLLAGIVALLLISSFSYSRLQSAIVSGQQVLSRSSYFYLASDPAMQALAVRSRAFGVKCIAISESGSSSTPFVLPRLQLPNNRLIVGGSAVAAFLSGHESGQLPERAGQRALFVTFALIVFITVFIRGGGGGGDAPSCYLYSDSSNTGCLDDPGTCVWYAPNFGYTAVGWWDCCYVNGKFSYANNYNCFWSPNSGCCNILDDPDCPEMHCPAYEP